MTCDKGGFMVSDHTDEESHTEIEEAKIVRKIVFIIISSIILIVIIGGISSYFYISSALKPVDPKSDTEIEVEIPLGSSSTEIASILEENGVIKDERIFRFFIKFKNYSDFQAGEYTLSPSLTLQEIVEELQSGKIIDEPVHTVTIPEGKTLEQIAEIYSKKFTFSKEDFLNKANDEAYVKELINKYPDLLSEEILNDDIEMPLEGYVFPVTYDFYEEEPSIESIIEMMLDQTSKVFSEFQDLVQDQEMSIHDILTLASVVERESKFSEDRPKVAQVYMNRLANNMKLQSDITAFYGVEHKAVVTYEDLEVETPYNTYIIDGLPIGPIASPSLESIEGVLKPEGDDFSYLYYFSRPNGETFYSDTLEEHEQIKEKYRHEWYELEEEQEEKDEE